MGSHTQNTDYYSPYGKFTRQRKLHHADLRQDPHREELSPTTTSKRRAPSILCSDSGEVCRSSSRPWLARPSPLRSSPLTPLRTSRLRSRTRKAFPQTSRG